LTEARRVAMHVGNRRHEPHAEQTKAPITLVEKAEHSARIHILDGTLILPCPGVFTNDADAPQRRIDRAEGSSNLMLDRMWPGNAVAAPRSR